ncbi:hypothetical protein K439DRAFT_326891 [Ramaria rubella]|nr:hypothetical protein K439DRAFT_326891 [Ramaria rubella]
MPSTAPSSQPHRSNTAAPIASSSQAQTSTSEAPPPAPNNPAAAAAPEQPADSQVKTEPTIQPTATQSAEAQQAAAAQQEAAVQQEAAAQQAAAPKPAATQSTGTQPTVTQPAPIAPAATKPARPAVKNPLPSLPKDVLETERYRHLRRTDANGSNKWRYAAPVASAAYKPQLRSQYQPAGKEPTLRLPRPPAEIVPKEKVIPDNKIWIPKEKRAVSKNKQPKAKSSGPFGLLRAFARPSLSRKKLNRYSSSPAMDYQYRYGASVPRAPIPQFPPVLLDPPKLSGVPVTVYRNSNLNPTSPHRVLYKKKPYPTAAHLFEALKYLKHRPDLAEQIRMATDSATEIGTLSMSFQMEGLVRPDWQSVWKDKVPHLNRF